MIFITFILFLFKYLTWVGVGVSSCFESQTIVDTPFASSGIVVSTQKYEPYESRRYLKRDFHKDGYQPIELRIQNQTRHTYKIDSKSLGVEGVSKGELTKKIAGQVFLENLPRSVMWKVGAFFFWPLWIGASLDSAALLYEVSELKEELYAKSIKVEGEILPPYSVIHRVILVPKETAFQEITIDPKDLEKLTSPA